MNKILGKNHVSKSGDDCEVEPDDYSCSQWCMSVCNHAKHERTDQERSRQPETLYTGEYDAHPVGWILPYGMLSLAQSYTALPSILYKQNF